MVKTIIFDLGNVIVPFDIEIALKAFESASDLPDAELREKILDDGLSMKYHSGQISSADFFEFQKNLLKLKMNFADFANAWNSIFSLEPIIPETFIAQLAENYRLLILSDTNEIHFSFIKEKFSLLRHFDDFILSHEVGYLKPATEIFEAAVEKAECLPEECFFTDDKKENIEGAIDYGINAIQFFSAKQFETELQNRKLIP